MRDAIRRDKGLQELRGRLPSAASYGGSDAEAAETLAMPGGPNDR
jgi:hypothetical protein